MCPVFVFCLTPSGILKHVKDHIRECTHCQSRRNTVDSSGPRPFSQQGRRRAASHMNEDEEEEEEEEADDSSLFADSSSQLRSKWTKAMAAKHELVFVSFPPNDDYGVFAYNCVFC